MMRVNIPKWMDRFVNPQTNSVEFLYPFWVVVANVWYYIPRKILDYNIRDCEFLYPDWNHGYGTKVRQFFGFVLIRSQGEMLDWRWWRHLEWAQPDNYLSLPPL